MSGGASNLSSRTVMWRRLMLVLSAVIVLAAWGTAAVTYAVYGGGGYNGSLFASFIFVAGILTIGAGMLLVRTWRESVGALSAAFVSVLAALSVLWLALAINLRG